MEQPTINMEWMHILFGENKRIGAFLLFLYFIDGLEFEPYLHVFLISWKKKGQMKESQPKK